METKPRLISTLLLAAMVAAAFGRADLAADTEASVLWSDAFRLGLPLALLPAWWAAGQFGRGWGRAVLATLAVALPVGVATGLALGQGPTSLIGGVLGQPMALGALAFGGAAVQVLALRRAAKSGQSRK